MRVAVLGASPNPDRFSYKAILALRAKGHEVVPVNPGHREIDGLAVAPTLTDIEGPIDTVTVYVRPAHIDPLIPQIVSLKPRRVIINPGAESEPLAQALQSSGIDVVEACTLVMLAIGTF